MLLGQPGEAASAYQTAAALRPENLRYWENLATALFESRQYQRAIPVIEDEWLPRNENSGLAYQMLGHAYLQIGDANRALEALRAAESLVTDPTMLQNDLIVALRQPAEVKNSSATSIRRNWVQMHGHDWETCYIRLVIWNML